MRKYVIGDIRGELSLLNKLLQKIGPSNTDQLIFTGSYIGPGSDSKGVIDYLLHLNKDFPHMVFLKGCYEVMFGRCIETKPAWETMALWGKMGGDKVFKSYADDNIVVIKTGNNGKPTPMKAEVPMRIPVAHVNFMESLFQWFEDDIYPYVVCHSGGLPILFGGRLEHEEQTVFAEMGWWEQDERRIPNKTVIFSHYPFKEPFVRCGKIGLDLGAGLGGRLACYELFEEKFTIVG